MSAIRNRNSSRRGMSLVEIAIVLVVLGVVFAGVFMFFTRGTEHFHFARRQNELATTGRMTIERISDVLIWAGYMPQGGWSNDDWHPVEDAQDATLEFYADWEPTKVLDLTDYRQIDLLDGRIRIQDRAGDTELVGEFITDISYTYRDAAGSIIVPPMTIDERDLVRHVGIELTLASSYGGHVYQTVMHTTVSPRNLGVNHDVNPAFFPPPPMYGNVVFNVDGIVTPAPSADEQDMIDFCLDAGLTVFMVTDDSLTHFDYEGNSIDLLILRHLPHTTSHAFASTFLDSLSVPTIVLSARDAFDIYGMGTDYVTNNTVVTMNPYNTNHVINKHPFNTTWTVYGEPRDMSIVRFDSFTVDTELLTSCPPDSTWSGVCVKDEDEDTRRVHWSAWEAQHFTQNGWKYFYRILFWQLGGAMPDAGIPLNEMEDFEGDAPGSDPVTLWGDDLNDPSMPNDTTIIYYEDFENLLGLEWDLSSLSPQGRIQQVSGVLRMDRNSYSALNPTRNLAQVTLDLSMFDENSDDLVLLVETQKGSSETIDGNDGIFFTDADIDLDTLYTEDFTVFPLAPGDVTFYHSTIRGRHRVHSPGWGGDGAFVTLDVDADANWSYNRMMIELLTVHDPGALINVDYSFSDHGDESNPEDFIGWNSHGVISGAYNLLENLIPASYTNGIWTNRSASFAQTVASGAPLYVLFGQYDNYRATSATASDGISFDNIEITSFVSDTTYNRFAVPSSSAGWRSLVVDLDQAARDNTYPFDADYEMTLSQFGNGSWNSYGMEWDNFAIGKIETEFTIAGWSHGIAAGGYVDDWTVSEIFPGNYAWTLWANNPAVYSPDSYCWLQTPLVTIPGGATDVELSFQHSYNFEVGNDGGLVMISVDGGPWTIMTGLAYTGTATVANPIPAGTDIYTGTQIPVTETVDLSGYAGSTVRFRFVAASDASIENEGWILDNFNIEGMITGYAITALQFEALNSIPAWTLNYDLYMQSTTDASLASGPEWPAAGMVHAIAGGSLVVSNLGYYTLVLDAPFILPVGENLMVKIVQDNAAWTSQLNWNAGVHNSPFLCRGEHSDDPSPVPTNLTVIEKRPTIRLLTDSDPIIVEDGTSVVPDAPFDTYYMNNNFEAIYLAAEMEGGTAWVSGGTNNDWEIDAPIFTPDVDPALLPGNGNNIAGTDLTVDGFYTSDAWCWMRSSAYDMPVIMYDTTVVRFDRCIRLSANDFAHVQVAFTDTADPPDPADWINIRTYMLNQSIWELEELNLKAEFDAAFSAGRQYYWIRFVMDTGPFGARGGWNLDNIQFYGRDS